MKLHIPSTFILTFLISVFLAASCSHSSNSGSPVEPMIDIADLPAESEYEAGRNSIGVYEALIDPIAETFTLNPIERSGQYHYPLTELFPNCLQIADYGFTPNFWADIKLVHPLQGTIIDFFDPRVIAIVPTHWDAYFHYPSLGVYGNPKVVLEPDGYTKLFNELAPDIFGNVNPFIAYFKDMPFRRWSSADQTEQTKRWEMDIDAFSGDFRYFLVVDVSTNYPNLPYPRVANAQEPVNIQATVGSGLTVDGGEAKAIVTLHDWQGTHSIGGVKVEAPDIFDGTVSLTYSEPGANPDEYIYSGIIANEKFAPEGEYSYLVAAWDKDSEIYIYNQFTLNATLFSGNLIWAKSAGGTDFCRGYGITTLSDDSTVATGWFSGIATFGEGEPNETTLNAAGSRNIFIARYNPDGTLLWAKRAGGWYRDAGFGITTLSDNSTVVTGEFENTATFGPGEPNETILTSAGGWDIFIARYNPNGTLAWAKCAGGSRYDKGWAITSLSDDSTVVTGWIMDTATFGEGEPNETILASAGALDIFIARYNSKGTLEWAKRVGGADECAGLGITSLSDDSTVVTGYIRGTATFGEGEPNETILTSQGRDIFVARYNPNGTLAWVKCSENSLGYGITTLSDDSTVVTGYFGHTATFGEGEPNETILTSAGLVDIFIARYNTDGTLAWAKRAGGLSQAGGYAITTLSDDSTVVTGSLRVTAIFGEGEPNETVLTRSGIFIARYNPDGSLAWAKSASAGAYGSYGITALLDDSTVVTGYYEYIGIFGKGEPNETILTYAGSSNIFIARYKP